MTDLAKSRKKTLASVRGRDRAEALGELKQILDNLDKVQFDLEQTRLQISSTRAEATSGSSRGPISAAGLEMDALLKERLTAQLDALGERERKLSDRARELEKAADAARDKVGKAHKAFEAVKSERRD